MNRPVIKKILIFFAIIPFITAALGVEYSKAYGDHNPNLYVSSEKFQSNSTTKEEYQTNSDTAFTVSTFMAKYGNTIPKDGKIVTVLVKVIGESETVDPSKRDREIRQLQSSVLKFVIFAGGINVLTHTATNEFTAQIHPVVVQLLEQRGDVISVTIFDDLPPNKQRSHGRDLGSISCKENHVLITKYNGNLACVKPQTAEKLIQRGWGTITESKVMDTQTLEEQSASIFRIIQERIRFSDTL